MGKIAQALTTVADALQVSLGDAVEVKEHPGRFTEDELGRLLMKRQAVRVAIEGFPKLDVQGDGIRSADVSFIAFVVCADTLGEDRHRAALDIVEQAAGLIAYARWDDPLTFTAVAPTSIAVANLYSGELASGKGIAWWAVSWTQAIKNH